MRKIHTEINREAKLSSLDEVFRRFDKTGEGEIDLNELADGLESVGCVQHPLFSVWRALHLIRHGTLSF